MNVTLIFCVMKIKTYNIKNLSDKQIEELRFECRKQHLQETYRKSDHTTIVDAITGSADHIIGKYRRRGYRLCHDYCNSRNQHLLVFVKPTA